MIETKVNMIVSEVIKVLGPTVLRSFLNNGGQEKSPEDRARSDEDGSTVTAACPFDDEELLDEDEDNNIGGQENKGIEKDNSPETNEIPKSESNETTHKSVALPDDLPSPVKSTEPSLHSVFTDGLKSEGRIIILNHQ